MPRLVKKYTYILFIIVSFKLLRFFHKHLIQAVNTLNLMKLVFYINFQQNFAYL